LVPQVLAHSGLNTFSLIEEAPDPFFFAINAENQQAISFHYGLRLNPISFYEFLLAMNGKEVAALLEEKDFGSFHSLTTGDESAAVCSEQAVKSPLSVTGSKGCKH